MSGLEVIGGISAVIAILDGSVKVWTATRKDVQFSKTFQTVANRLPILLDTLQTCRAHLEPIQTQLPAEAVDGLLRTVQNCETKAQKLRTVFEKTIPGEDDQWYERYRKIAQRLGKGSKVEELLKSITEDAQNLVNYQAVKSARPELCSKLEEVIKEMEAIEPSLPYNDDLTQTFNAYGGYQNISTGTSTQHININPGSGTMNNFGGITGNPVFHLGKN